MAEVCEATGADVTLLADAIGHDARIGRQVPQRRPRVRRRLPAQGHPRVHGPGRRARRRPGAVVPARGRRDQHAAPRRASSTCARERLRRRRPRQAGRRPGRRLQARQRRRPRLARPSTSPAQIQLQGAQVTVYDPAANDNAAGAVPDAGLRRRRPSRRARAPTSCCTSPSGRSSARWTRAVLGRRSSPQKRVIDGRNALDRERWRDAGWDVRVARPPVTERATVREVLALRTWAVVGLRDNPARAAYGVARVPAGARPAHRPRAPDAGGRVRRAGVRADWPTSRARSTSSTSSSTARSPATSPTRPSRSARRRSGSSSGSSTRRRPNGCGTPGCSWSWTAARSSSGTDEHVMPGGPPDGRLPGRRCAGRGPAAGIVGVRCSVRRAAVRRGRHVGLDLRRRRGVGPPPGAGPADARRGGPHLLPADRSSSSPVGTDVYRPSRSRASWWRRMPAGCGWSRGTCPRCATCAGSTGGRWRRSDFRTASGQRFDAFALDIEPSGTTPAGSLRDDNLRRLSSRIRSSAPAGYRLGAIVPSPLGMSLAPRFWPDFPWPTIGGSTTSCCR